VSPAKSKQRAFNRLMFLCSIVAIAAACQRQPADVQQSSESAVVSIDTSPGENHPGFMGMKNVYQVVPSDTLINASPDTDVNIMYNKAIAASNEELQRAIEVFDKEGNLVHGTLAIDHYRAFLVFCAKEPYQPGQYTAKYQSVLLEGGERTKAFQTTWEVEGNSDPNPLSCQDAASMMKTLNAGVYAHTVIATY
jgi:hypothetical protein